jgi:pimeloyl-ACP methyl ester carboxylesterase
MNNIGRFVFGLMLAAIAASTPAGANDSAHEPHRVEIIGEGTKTMVFEAGLGDTLDVWRNVQAKAAAQCARTFSYNRAGYPGSPAVAGERDAPAVVAELRAELQSRGLAPPYVLVGHSLGGLYMQYFARNFPEEVAGLLLVDSTHWNQLHRIHEATPFTYGMVRALSMIMRGVARREFAASEAAGQQTHASPPPKGIATIVLSSSRAAPGETPAFRILMRRLQDDMAEEFAAKRHDFPIASGHYIQRDQPMDVVRAARELAGC